MPRDRPTDTAILSQLGTFASAAQAGHSYLPDSAMALIAEHQHGAGADRRLPALSTRPVMTPTRGSWPTAAYRDASLSAYASGAHDGTSGSHTALPGFKPPDALSAMARATAEQAFWTGSASGPYLVEGAGWDGSRRGGAGRAGMAAA